MVLGLADVDTGLHICVYTQGPHFMFDDGRGTGEREEKMDISQTKGLKVCVSTQVCGVVERGIALDHGALKVLLRDDNQKTTANS